ncbi:MAG: S8 family peptidase, partial [Candidatus Hodarchaeales archaeon]
MKKIKSLIKPLLLLFIVQIGFLNMLAPLVDNNRSTIISIEPIALPTPSYKNLQPEIALQERSFHDLEYMADEWIIPSHQVSELMNEGKIQVKKELAELGLTIVKTISSETALNRSPHVFQNFIIRNDELSSTSASYLEKNSLETTLEWVGAEDLHNSGLDGTGITVAILDSGISSHNLVNALSGSKSYVDPDDGHGISDGLGHGTQVASIVSQVAPEASLYNFRVFDSEGQTELTWILEALNDVLAMNETIDIVQMSFGGYGIVNEMNTVMNQLISAGLIPIVAAGNSGPYGQSISRPAHSPYTIAVGAAISPNEVAAFSSQGPRLNGLAGPELIAPGFNVEVASLEMEGATIYQNGTSFAAPFVSGGVALLLSGNSLTRETRNESRFWKLKAALMSSANSLDEFPSIAVGAGFVDLENAFETLDNDVVVSMAPRSINPSNYFFQISTNGQIKKFPISIYSAEEYTVSHQPFEVPPGIQLNLSIPDRINIGLNILNLSIEIDKNLKMDKYRTNLDLQINSKLLSLEINLETRYSGGRILWDLRHDNDTNSAAFSNGYFGDNSVLAYSLTSIGRASAAVVGNESDFYGTGYTYQSEEIIQALENHDLLVISDPEIPYLANEISIIQSWVSQGNSLLVIADLDNQTDGTQGGTDHTTLNTLLDDYGITITNQRIPADQNSTVRGTTVSHEDSAIGPFSSQFRFDFIGVALEVTENSNSKTIAYSGDNAIAAAHRTTLGGAVVVVGSSFPFSNLAYYIPSSDSNFKFSFQIIEWLLNAQQPVVTFAYSTNPLGFL